MDNIVYGVSENFVIKISETPNLTLEIRSSPAKFPYVFKLIVWPSFKLEARTNKTTSNKSLYVEAWVFLGT